MRRVSYKSGPFLTEVWVERIQDLDGFDADEFVVGNYTGDDDEENKEYVCLIDNHISKHAAKKLAETVDGICVGFHYCFNCTSFLGEYAGDGLTKIIIFNAVETEPENAEVRIVIPGTDYEKYIAYKKGSIV